MQQSYRIRKSTEMLNIAKCHTDCTCTSDFKNYCVQSSVVIKKKLCAIMKKFEK